jgi:hypothetical protein
LHSKNLHNDAYQFDELIKSHPKLEPFVFVNDHQTQTIDFSSTDAVLHLNKALLKHHYQVSDWDIPTHYLCPPIPGRADYIHYLADLLAENKSPKNCEYLLADILQNPLGKKKFDLIVALNMFELVEPSLLLKIISNQISNGFIFLSDPYDYERGKNSVKNPLDENQIRKILCQNGFQISKTTKTSSKINWNLKINERTRLNYKVDIIIARKSS